MRTKPIWLLLFPVVLIFVLSVLHYWEFTAEDAYIVCRYAENFVDIGSLVFNEGESICALTSPLHALLESGLYMLTGATLLSYKVLSLVFVVLSVVIILRLFGDRPYSQVVVVSVLLLCPCVILWTVGGMETPVLMFLLTVLCALVYAEGEISLTRQCIICFVAGLSFVTRFDSVLFTVPMVLYSAARGGGRKKFIIAALLGLLIPLAWLIISVQYYGDLLPTSFYIKRPDLYYREMIRNAIYIFQYLIMSGLIPFAVFFLVSGRSPVKAVRRVIEQGRRLWGVYLGIFFVLCYGLTVATKHMMFSFRFFVPCIPASVIILANLFEQDKGDLQQGTAPQQFSKYFCFFVVGIIVFQVYQLFYTYHYSLNGIVADIGRYNIGEYKEIGVKDYAKEFMPLLEKSANDIQQHWESLDKSKDRPPRIVTFAAGLLPYTYKEAYIYEALVSYRHGRRYGTRRSADYIHLYKRADNPAEVRLPSPVENYELISSYTIPFNGTVCDFQVYFNPEPADNKLPPGINDFR